MEEENEEEMVVGHAHRTGVSDRQMGEGRVEDVADKVVVGMVAAWLPPSADTIDRLSVREQSEVVALTVVNVMHTKALWKCFLS